MEKDCLICKQEFNRDYVVFEDAEWLIRHSEETNILGYFIIQTRRHILDLAAASEKECRSYGPRLKALTASIKELADCERVYTFSLAEAVPHYHLHVIPRRENFPRAYKGRGITAYPTEPACARELVEEICRRIRALINRQSKQPVN